MTAQPQRPARGDGQRRFFLQWTGLACAGVLGVVAYTTYALRSQPSDVPAGMIAVPTAHWWLFLAVIAALILLVVHAFTASGGRGNTVAGPSYVHLLESSPVPMWVVEEGTWRILEVNCAAIEKYGYAREEFLNMTAGDLQVAEDRAAVEAQLRVRDAGLTTHARRRHRTKLGDTIIAEVTARPLLFQGRAARMIVVSDVTTRARSEEALQESESRYRDLFERSPTPAWVYEAESLRFLAVNDAALQRYGYDRETFLGLTILDLNVPEDVPMVRARAEHRESGAYYQRQAHHKTRDGTVIEMDIRSGPVRFGGRHARQVLGHDVTERVRMEQALRESEERLRTIADNLPALIGYVDAEQRYRFANKSYEEWFGVSPAEIVGTSLREWLGEAHYAEVRGDIEVALSGRAITAERPARRSVRKIIARVSYIPHIGHGGEVHGFYVLGYDVTERREVEEAVARERALLRAVIDNLPENVYVKDRDCRYLLMNAAGLLLRGAEREEDVLGRAAADFYPAAAAQQFDAEDRMVIESGKPLINRERSHVRADGSQQWYLGTKVPLRDVAGNIVGVVGIGREITELRKGAETIRTLNAELEQRVRERTAQLEAANRELEAFSYSVSHDLKAPLRSIDGFSRALREDFSHVLEPAGQEFLDRISAASLRMGELIDNLLALSRVTRAEMVRVPVDLTSMAQEIVADLRKSAPAHAVEVVIAPGLTGQGDPGLLRVVLENLLANAWKFTGARARAKIEIGAKQRGGLTAYYVRDNGAGFDMAYAGRLFIAFQRLHAAKEFPGTGVGLATVQRVIYRHGGRIWAEGAVDGGATFHFTLP